MWSTRSKQPVAPAPKDSTSTLKTEQNKKVWLEGINFQFVESGRRKRMTNSPGKRLP